MKDKSQPSAVHVAPESLLMKATSLTMSSDEPSDTDIRQDIHLSDRNSVNNTCGKYHAFCTLYSIMKSENTVKKKSKYRSLFASDDKTHQHPLEARE